MVCPDAGLRHGWSLTLATGVKKLFMPALRRRWRYSRGGSTTARYLQEKQLEGSLVFGLEELPFSWGKELGNSDRDFGTWKYSKVAAWVAWLVVARTT